MRFAYADPPYLGQCRQYGHRHEAPWGCWDDPETHRQLIDWLCAEFPDGWALSAISTTLRTILPLCPDDVRVGAWCKTFAAFKKGVRPAYHWEPIIFWRGRNPISGFKHLPPPKDGKQTTPKDYCEVNDDELLGILAPITMQKGLTGAKPEKVCLWILGLLNVQEGDEVVDVFPGTDQQPTLRRQKETRPMTDNPQKTQPASLYADPEMQQGVATVEVPAPFYPSLIEYQGDIYKQEPGYGSEGNYTKVTDLFKAP